MFQVAAVRDVIDVIDVMEVSSPVGVTSSSSSSSSMSVAGEGDPLAVDDPFVEALEPLESRWAFGERSTSA